MFENKKYTAVFFALAGLKIILLPLLGKMYNLNYSKVGFFKSYPFKALQLFVALQSSIYLR